jgi:glycogen(starch) synthase
MLGWEYPPNISGGLGVACHGLSEALKQEDVDVTFVVPHLSGVEEKSEVKLVSASRIEIEQQKPDGKGTRKDLTKRKVDGSSMTSQIIKIESSLSPYDLAGTDPNLSVIEHWNGGLFEEVKKHHVDGADHSGEKKFVRYTFRGGYGPRLLDEVERYALVVGQLAKNTDFDIIHAHDWMTFPAAMRVKAVSGKPLIIHFHATEYDRAGDSGSQRVYEIERAAIEGSDRIIVVSKWTSKVLVSKYVADESKIDVVHNGIIKAEKDTVRRSSPLGDKIITFLGRITFQKGPEYFVRAAKKVLEEFPDCHFVMAGAGDALPSMIKMVAGNGMSSRFHFTGFLDKVEMERLLSFSTAYVMPSVSEPFGLTPLEAIQAGVPVIISRQSGVSEILSHALKIDFWNIDELASAIKNIIKHKSLAVTLSANAKKDIDGISWRPAARKIKHIYHETITKK